MTAVYGLYADPDSAQRAVYRLLATGVPSRPVGMIEDEVQGGLISEQTPERMERVEEVRLPRPVRPRQHDELLLQQRFGIELHPDRLHLEQVPGAVEGIGERDPLELHGAAERVDPQRRDVR